MSLRSTLQRNPRSCAAIHVVDERLDYALAEETENGWQIVRESSADSLAGLIDALRPTKPEVITGLPCEQVLCRTIRLPATADDELKQMLALQIDQLTPVPLEDVVYDYETLAHVDGETLVLVAIAPKGVVNEQVSQFEDAGLQIKRVSIDALGLYRAFLQSGIIDRDNRLNSLVLLEPGMAHILVHTEGWPLMVRSLYCDVESAALPEFLYHEVRSTELSVQADWSGREMGTLRIAATTPALAAQASALADSWDLTEFLVPQEAVPSPARCLCPDASPGRRFNLLPAEWGQRRQAARTKRLIARCLAGVGVAYLLALGGFALFRQIQNMRISSVQGEIMQLEPDYQSARQLNSELIAMQKQLDTRFSSLDILREVSALMSDQIKLTKFDFDRDQKVYLKGQANAAQVVYNLISGMKESELFGNVELTGPGVRTQGSSVTFELVATLSSADQQMLGGGS